MSTIRKVLDLFEPRERWTVIWLFLLIVLMALVQTVGVASILPFMSLVADPEIIQTNAQLAWLYDRFEFQSTRSFLIFAGLLVLAITAFSNGFTALTHWFIVRFIWRKQYQISVRLLAKYLRQPYSFFLERNTAALAKTILAEVKEAINGVVMPGMKMFAQAIVALSIFSLLIVVDVQLALISVLVLGGAYGFLYTVVRRKQGRLGRQRTAANAQRFKTASEALGGIKETKVLGREREFLKRFSQPARRYSQVNASNAVISEIPRYALETVAFGGILLVVLYILNTQQDFGKAIAVMSLYTVAGYRLMPALQQIFHGLAKARFFAAALDELHADLVGDKVMAGAFTALDPVSSEPVGFQRSIELDGIHFRYPHTDTFVVRNTTLEIRKNTTIGFVGSTGSGKTTLVDIILGLLEPQQGVLRVDGVAITAANMGAWRQRLGYVPQHIYLCDDTIGRNIAFGVPDDEIRMDNVLRAARIAHLHEFIETLPAGYETVVGERGVRLSGGQRQRIGIARALYHDPDLLIMDEATSALDGITEDVVMDAIRDLAYKKTIILVAHRISTLRDCDTIYLFNRGEIAASGSYAELMSNNVQFRAMAKSTLVEAVTP